MIKPGDPLTMGNCQTNNTFVDKNGVRWVVVPRTVRVTPGEWQPMFEWQPVREEGPW